MSRHRPNIFSSTSPILLTPTTYNSSKSKPLTTRTTHTQTNIYNNFNCSSTIHHPSLLNYRTHTILYLLRSNPNPYTNSDHTMRKPTRTSKCGNLLPLLHTHKFPPLTNRNPIPTLTNRYSLPSNPKTHSSPPIIYPNQLLIHTPPKYSPTHSLHSKSTSIWSTSMTTQGSRRSSNRRIHTTCRSTSKTRRIWYHTNYYSNKPTFKQLLTLPIHHPRLMRSINNQLNLFTPN